MRGVGESVDQLKISYMGTVASYGGRSPLFQKSYFVYLLSCADGTVYTGCTSNLEDRFNRHMLGWVPATKGRLPVQLVLYTVFPDKYQAFAFEKYLKSGSGRAFAKRHFLHKELH
jgi:putative endonuclease